MTLSQILEDLGFDADRLLESGITEQQEDMLFDMKIEVHQQQNYPLKGSLANVRMLDGKLCFASGTASEYGDRAAWDED